MIRPTKYMDPGTCVLRVSAVLLREVRRYLALPLSEIAVVVEEQLGEDALANCHRAMSLLFLLGFIEYDEPSDAVVFTERKAVTQR